MRNVKFIWNTYIWFDVVFDDLYFITMSGASRISPPFSGAAGKKHKGSTDFRLSIVIQMTFALKLREDVPSSLCGPSSESGGRIQKF